MELNQKILESNSIENKSNRFKYIIIVLLILSLLVLCYFTNINKNINSLFMSSRSSIILKNVKWNNNGLRVKNYTFFKTIKVSYVHPEKSIQAERHYIRILGFFIPTSRTIIIDEWELLDD